MRSEDVPPWLAARLQQSGIDIDQVPPEQLEMIMRMIYAQRVQRSKPTEMLPASECLEGADAPPAAMPPPGARHLITGNPIDEVPAGHEVAMLGMGCFWCSENLFMRERGVYSTAVGYAGGQTTHPTYRQLCTGKTNHNEVVRIVFDPAVLPYDRILRTFWETHDPTTPMRQSGDCGTQYRSGIYYADDAQLVTAEVSKERYAEALTAAGHTAPISTEIVPMPTFYFAEASHQQRDARPDVDEYCGLAPLGVAFPSTP